MGQVEKLDLNTKAAYSFFTDSSVEPVTTQTNPPTGPCSFELPIDVHNHGLRYICIAILFHKGPFKFYKACKFNKRECPLNQYSASKIVYDEPLEIEKKWKTIKTNGR